MRLVAEMDPGSVVEEAGALGMASTVIYAVYYGLHELQSIDYAGDQAERVLARPYASRSAWRAGYGASTRPTERVAK